MFSDDIEQILNSAQEQKMRTFREVCKKIVNMQMSGELTIMQAAYVITNIIFHSDMPRKKQIEVIFALSGELELPVEFTNIDEEKLWKELIAAINNVKE